MARVHVSTPAGLSAKRPLETPGDRAVECGKFGQRRIVLEIFGFSPNNRGGVGCVG